MGVPAFTDNEVRTDLGDGSKTTSIEEQRATGSQEAVDGVALERAIETLESKKTKWWAYLATRDFWIVLLIGYASYGHHL